VGLTNPRHPAGISVGMVVTGAIAAVIGLAGTLVLNQRLDAALRTLPADHAVTIAHRQAGAASLLAIGGLVGAYALSDRGLFAMAMVSTLLVGQALARTLWMWRVAPQAPQVGRWLWPLFAMTALMFGGAAVYLAGGSTVG